MFHCMLFSMLLSLAHTLYPIIIHDNVDNALQQLRERYTQQAFTFCDLNFPQQEQEVFENLHIINLPPFDIYGSPEDQEDAVTDYLVSLGNEHELARVAASAIIRLSLQVLTAFDVPACWLTLRASNPNHRFDIPRWHIDGYFYPPRSGMRVKFATTLKGPGTLCAEVTSATRAACKAMREEIWQELKQTFEGTQREKSIECSKRMRMQCLALFPEDEVIQTPNRIGLFFIVGDETCAAYHSEPKIDQQRLFMSIVPGTHEQIESWKAANKD